MDTLLECEVAITKRTRIHHANSFFKTFILSVPFALFIMCIEWIAAVEKTDHLFLASFDYKVVC